MRAETILDPVPVRRRGLWGGSVAAGIGAGLRRGASGIPARERWGRDGRASRRLYDHQGRIRISRSLVGCFLDGFTIYLLIAFVRHSYFFHFVINNKWRQCETTSTADVSVKTNVSQCFIYGFVCGRGANGLKNIHVG